MSISYSCFISFVLIFISSIGNIATAQSYNNPDDGYIPGFKMYGISLKDASAFNSNKIRTTACDSKSTATIKNIYLLTNKVYLFQTDAGYGVANMNLSAKDLDTGISRRKLPTSYNQSCKLNKNSILTGNFDCYGPHFASLKDQPKCVYEITTWEHSGKSESDMFHIVYKKLQEQFVQYKDQCTLIRKPTLEDRMQIF